MQELIIPGSMLEDLKLSASDLRLELAVYLYDKERLSFAQSKKLAGLSQIAFQKALSKRGVAIKYGISDFEKDLETLTRL
jgi:predicted HTH domain antitoxin